MAQDNKQTKSERERRYRYLQLKRKRALAQQQKEEESKKERQKPPTLMEKVGAFVSPSSLDSPQRTDKKFEISGTGLDYLPQPDSKEPSKVAEVVRMLMRTSVMEKMNTEAAKLRAIDEGLMPKQKQGESPRDYYNRAWEEMGMAEREKDIARQGTMKQLEAPMMAGMAMAGLQNPLAVAKPLAKYMALHAGTEKLGLGEAIQNIQDPTLRDVADIARFAGEGFGASRSWRLPQQVRTPLGKANLALRESFIPYRSIQNFLGKPVRWYRKFTRLSGSKPNADVFMKERKMTAAEELAALSEKKGISLEKTRQDIIRTRAAGKERIALNKKYYDTEYNNTKKIMNENVRNLSNALQQEADVGAMKIQKQLPEFYRENSKGYSQQLDKITANMAKRNEKITVGEVNNILKKTVSELDQAYILEGAPRNRIQMLVDKYQIRVDPKTKANNLDQQVPFKQIIDDMRGVTKALSSGAKKGNTRFTEEDVAASILKKNLGEYVKERVPEFAELQKEYGPIIEIMKKSNEIFRPYKGEYDTTKGAKILKDIALGKVEPTSANARLIKALETGTQFSEGISPNLRKPITKKAIELQEAKKSMDMVLEGINKARTAGKEKVDAEMFKRLDTLTNRKDFIEGSYLKKEAMVKKVLEDRLLKLGMKKDKINSILADRKKVRETLFKLGIGTALISSAFAGTAYGVKAIGDALSP